MKKDFLVLILLLVFAFPAVKALFEPGGFTSHDLTHHIIRQISMDKLLSEGQFPPRWSGELNEGFGYPVFLFNYPLPAMLGEIFHKLGFNFETAVKAVLLLSLLGAPISMYFFLRSLLNNKLAAFLGAIFYLYAPIRFLNVYVSAAVGSALSAVFVPLVFWALIKRKVLPGGLALAGLVLSHNVTALIFMPLILTFVILKAKRQGFVILFLGFGLSAWFWMPALMEKEYLNFEAIFGKFYLDQFPSLWQLIRSPWGYGLSHPQNPESGDMSYQLGLIHILVMIVFSLWYMVYGRKTKDKFLGIFTLAAFILSIFLMLKISLPLWDNLPLLSMVQFPLRFQAIAIFSASIAAALLVKYAPYKKTAFLILLGLVIYANRNHWNINEKFDPGEDYYLSLNSTSSSYGEHLPKWGRIMDKPAPGKLEFISGGGKISLIKNQSAKVLAEVEATTSSKLRFNQFYFPGWEIKVDNKKVDFNYLIEGESYGLPTFDIEVGIHQINAEFKSTLVRNIADIISVITGLSWLGLLFSNRLIKKSIQFVSNTRSS